MQLRLFEILKQLLRLIVGSGFTEHRTSSTFFCDLNASSTVRAHDNTPLLTMKNRLCQPFDKLPARRFHKYP